MPEKIRIAVLHFAHETVTFLKNDTTLSMISSIRARRRRARRC